MAVEARYLNNSFSPQHVNNRAMMMNAVDVNGNMYNNVNGNFAGAVNGGLVGYGSIPISGTTTIGEALFSMYNNNSSVIVDSTCKAVTATPHMKDDSSVSTYNFPAAVSISRKRSRDIAGMNTFISGYGEDFRHCNNNNTGVSFLGEDISSQFVLQQLYIDRLVSQHTERVRIGIGIEESRKRHSRKLIEAAEIGIMKRLRAKEEEIDKIGKVNHALEERIKCLYVQNQIWRDLAQNNEATVNTLRSNLELVLSQLKDSNDNNNDAVATNMLDQDAESCCGSSDDCANNNIVNEVNRENHRVWRTVDEKVTVAHGNKVTRSEINRMCKRCGREESCVLLLPCRYLCLCKTCGSSVHTCPICKSNQTASVHVNISSS